MVDGVENGSRAALECVTNGCLATPTEENGYGATILGAKLLTHEDGTQKRGQQKVYLSWYIDIKADRPTHRPEKFDTIASALMRTPHRQLIVQYDAEAISTRLRELSQELCPRRRHHVSAICYRELFAAESKAAGMPLADLAAAMAHLSTESQGRYAAAGRRKSPKRTAQRTFSTVTASSPVRTDRSPMSRFKRANKLKSKCRS